MTFREKKLRILSVLQLARPQQKGFPEETIEGRGQIQFPNGLENPPKELAFLLFKNHTAKEKIKGLFSERLISFIMVIRRYPT